MYEKYTMYLLTHTEKTVCMKINVSNTHIKENSIRYRTQLTMCGLVNPVSKMTAGEGRITKKQTLKYNCQIVIHDPHQGSKYMVHKSHATCQGVLWGHLI